MYLWIMNHRTRAALLSSLLINLLIIFSINCVVYEMLKTISQRPELKNLLMINHDENLKKGSWNQKMFAFETIDQLYTVVAG